MISTTSVSAKKCIPRGSKLIYTPLNSSVVLDYATPESLQKLSDDYKSLYHAQSLMMPEKPSTRQSMTLDFLI